MTVVETGTNSYTHVVCGRCGLLLYCSDAEPMVPQEEFGWCPHEGDEDGPTAVYTDWPTDEMLHNCQGEMRPPGGRNSDPA